MTEYRAMEDKAESARWEAEKQETASIVRATPVTVLCPECQELIEVHDIHAVLLALHLQNECALSPLFGAHRDGG